MAAAAAVPAVPRPVAKGVDFGVEYGPEKYSITWWDKVELDAFVSALHQCRDRMRGPARLPDTLRPQKELTKLRLRPTGL